MKHAGLFTNIGIFCRNLPVYVYIYVEIEIMYNILCMWIYILHAWNGRHYIPIAGGDLELCILDIDRTCRDPQRGQIDVRVDRPL